MDFSAFTAWDFRSIIHPMIDNGARREAAQQITLLRIDSIMSHGILSVTFWKQRKKRRSRLAVAAAGRRNKTMVHLQSARID